MGVTVETLTVRNSSDIAKAQEGLIQPDQIRTVSVTALVDTGASFVGLHKKEIDYLGLYPVDNEVIRTANGVIIGTKYQGAQSILLGRFGTVDIFRVDDSLPPIIGFILLEALNLIVDPVEQKVKVHPNNGGRETHLFLYHGAA